MATLKSIFGPYATKLQVAIDESLDKFDPTFFQNYFSWGMPSGSLNYTTVIGASRIEAIASIVSRDSKTPLRSRPGLSKLNGEVPAIKEMFKMTESQMRDFKELQQSATSDERKMQIALDTMFGDVKKVGNAAMKRVDWLALQALSTGKIQLSTTNNPDGLITDADIDLLMPAGNRKNSAVTWGTAATATPIDDIQTIVTDAEARGFSIAKLLMTKALYLQFAATKQVNDYLAAMLRVSKGNVLPTLANVNEFLTSQLLPIIEIVSQNKQGVEKDGIISTIQPFSDNVVSAIPAGNLGEIKLARAIEETERVEGISYAFYNNALISKWSDNEPWTEYTKVELNACPSLDAIDQIYILTAVH